MAAPIKLKAREQGNGWSSIWFHGQMEDTIAANSDEQQVDLVGSDAPAPTEEGIFLVDVYGVNGLAYVWKNDFGITGLVVDPSNGEDNAYAASCFKMKTAKEQVLAKAQRYW